jgi:hypothetical protein
VIERRAISAGAATSSFVRVGFIQGAGTSTASQSYEFTDHPGVAGRYAYRVTTLDRDGTLYHGLEIETQVAAPASPELFNNYPNPFNPTTVVRFALPQSGQVNVTVVDMLGRHVATLVDGHRDAGIFAATWDASSLPSGVYFCRLAIDGAVVVRSMQLVK